MPSGGYAHSTVSCSCTAFSRLFRTILAGYHVPRSALRSARPPSRTATYTLRITRCQEVRHVYFCPGGRRQRAALAFRQFGGRGFTLWASGTPPAVRSLTLNAGSVLARCRKDRVRQQAHGQKRAKTHIERQTETGPPLRHSRVLDEPMMSEVEHSMSNRGGNDQPGCRLESDDRGHKKYTRSDDFNRECSRGRSHHGEEDVIGRDHKEHRR